MTEKRAARAARDQRARFEALARTVTEPLHRYLLRRAEPDQVDDVLSETLLVLWRRVDDVPGLDAEDIPDPDAVLPWCYGVARGCLANARRADRRRRSLLERLSTWRTESGPAESTEQADTDHTALHEALAQLRALDREIVLLWAYEELTPSRIAEVTGLSANAVSIRLHRAKKKLAARLERKTAAPPGHETTEGTEKTEETEETEKTAGTEGTGRSSR
ncbi:sigma-70 family RNA polymerase sigma factor [Streptomyces sp. ME02-8801-2C]|uniref:RNA polymerase sigma factor n=1 Tax=Streptomyces sp. ME02-8801-2C TaxID=3028680 RepID=UPI0029AA2DBF|nr:sigma-70 family RNA polymerase sigma factor [Streptomyces sp. ME02-8801-2C]MDX3453998.1 sigma-70 family RNA polymerase sigma factor [Streptomyces sp. ME02-8801-2C]